LEDLYKEYKLKGPGSQDTDLDKGLDYLAIY